MDAGVEIGVVADREGHVQVDLVGRDQRGMHHVLAVLVGQQLEDADPQRIGGCVALCKQGVERLALGKRGRFARLAVEQQGYAGDVEDMVADRHADAPSAPALREHPQGQVLYRELGMVVGAVHP